MANEDFFEDPKEQSLVKSEIVSDYFWVWARIIASSAKKYYGAKLAYVDLFSGPGEYEDGTKATPLKVLEKAIEDPVLSQMLVTVFNDKDPKNCASLQESINNLRGIQKLKYPPEIRNEEVASRVIESFEKVRGIPTLLFVDPWGYKGLTLPLINSVLQNWGCDCIFFFNYNRINSGLNNPKVEEHMNALFGQERAEELREKLLPMKPYEREATIIEALTQALKDADNKYVLPFRFIDSVRNRTSHHLVFVSKHPKGYEIMKDIMAKESSRTSQGVASFEYNPSDKSNPLLFELSRPIDDLAEMLLTDFAGKTLTRKEVYEMHHIDKPYTKKNYREVLLQLEANGRITTSPPASNRRAGTFSETKVKITFPQV